MRKHWPIIVAIPALAWRVMLAFNGEPLWYDEAFSVVVARLPLERLLTATAGDVHPPLYYLLLKLWLPLFGAAPVEAAARSLSLLLSVIALALFALLLYRLDLPETERRIAWALAAWLPGLSYFSAEARMYALLEALILGAALCLLYVPKRGDRWAAILARYAGGGVLIGLAALTHNVGLIYAPSLAITAALFAWRRGAALDQIGAALLVVTGAAIAVYTPWLPNLLGQLSATTTGGYWVLPPSVGSVAYALYMAITYTVIEVQGLDAALMLVIGALTTWGAVAAWRDNPESVTLPALVIGLAFVASHVAGVGMLLHRLLLPLTFFIVVGWARLLTRLPAAALPVALLLLVGNGLYAGGRNAADYSLWATVDIRPGDIIYANNSAVGPLLVYVPGVASYVAYQAAPMATGLSPQTLAAIGAPMTRLEALDWRRAWYLFFEVPYTTEHERAYKDALIATFNGELVADLGGAEFTHGELWLLQK